MSDKIFTEIFDQQTLRFKQDFLDSSKAIFWDQSQSSLIHPGEYGVYREGACKEYLRTMLPGQISIDTGFVITSKGDVSTQCDLILFDKEITPILRSLEHQRFYPAETVVGVGEVKSILSKGEFKKALNKLSKVKMLRDGLKNDNVVSLNKRGIDEFDTHRFITNRMISFLICERLDFNTDNLVDEFEALYEDVEVRNRHNLILSLEDGLFLYRQDKSPYAYPDFDGQVMINANIPTSEDLIPYYVFAQSLYTSTIEVKNPYFNMYKYFFATPRDFKIITEDRK